MTCPIIIAFDYAVFQSQIPEYSKCPPQATVLNYWNMAVLYMSDINYGPLHYHSRQMGLNLLTAHLIFLDKLIQEGTTPYVMQVANIDKITVTLVPPPVDTELQWWLMCSPYGAKLRALIQAHVVGGSYIGGSPVVASLGFGRGW